MRATILNNPRSEQLIAAQTETLPKGNNSCLRVVFLDGV